MGVLLRWLSMGFLVRARQKQAVKSWRDDWSRWRVASMIALGVMCGFSGVGWVRSAYALQNLNGLTCKFTWDLQGLNPCPAFFTIGGCDRGYEVACVGGVPMQNSNFYYRSNVNGLCSDGFGYVPCPTEFDTCSCGGGGCSGTCGYYVMNSQVMPASNNCSQGCSCPPASDFFGFPDGYYSRDCRATVQPCGGGVHWVSAVVNGQVVWQIQNSTCAGNSGTCFPVCPSWAANGAGEETDTACSSSPTGTCPSRTVTCSGTCTYTAIATGQGGYTWQLLSSNCTAGANNCECPYSPGGQCPTQLGITTIPCGSTGGPCTPGQCSGSCNYISVSDGNGGFRWSLANSNCTTGVNNCNCPAEPGGDCPKSLRETKIVTCGTVGGSCKKAECDAFGGDADNDGCCFDTDIDDNDPAVCAADCKGYYVLCTANPLNDTAAKISCDPATWTGRDGWTDCTCQRLQNGDRDKDKCCDAVDKWPDDPKKGCPCCDYEQAWADAGGAELYAQYLRIVGTYGAGSQFISYSSQYDRFDIAAPTGDPNMLSLTIPVSVLTAGVSSDYTMRIPLTLPQLETVLNDLGVGSLTGAFSAVDTVRVWFRTSLAWLVALGLVTLILQELRV